MQVDPNRKDYRDALRTLGFEGDSYGAPTEYDPGMLTQIIPDGTGMATVGYAENKRYGVGSPSGYRKFSEIHKTSSRALPSKKGFKVKN